VEPRRRRLGRSTGRPRDKTAAESKFGYSVNTHGVGDVVKYVNEVFDADITKLVNDYEQRYELPADLKTGHARHKSIREAARIELGLRAFLAEGNFKGFRGLLDKHYLRKHGPGA
jgi:L-arabinose isomerase